MATIGEELEGYVINQINARQTLHGSGVGHTGNLRTDKQINLLNSNTSWIKLASGVSISGSNRLTELGLPLDLISTKLAENFVLFSGVSNINTQVGEVTDPTTNITKTVSSTQLKQREGFLPRDGNSSYTYGTFGYSPMPGIISADIKTLTRGSLKKATVKLIANNREQFDIIDLLYMRLGYTVLLEWGNSIYTTNGEDKKILRNTLIEEKFFSSNGYSATDSYFTFLTDIEDKRAEHKGNYDALLGKVSNFSWNFNEDGSYDIELTIISLGDVIESLKSNLSVDKVTNNFLKNIKEADKVLTEEPTSKRPDIKDEKYARELYPDDPWGGPLNALIADNQAWEEAEKAKEEEEEEEEEEEIDDENSSADTITALLTIWKYISQNVSEAQNIQKTADVDASIAFINDGFIPPDATNPNNIQLSTENSDTGATESKIIGSLLDPNIEEGEITTGIVEIQFTATYDTLATREEERRKKAEEEMRIYLRTIRGY